MTCREKLRQEHPMEIDPKYEGGCFGCPSTYGYMNDDEFLCMSNACVKCWDREIPSTKPTEKEPKTKKMTTKKTKTELLEEIANLKKQLESAERYAKCEEAANELKIMHNSLINAGFTEKQAFSIIIETIKSGLKR